MEGFLNPYNFIAFPEKKSKKYQDEDLHTGVIEYKITTKTPLFIPNTSNDNAFRLKTEEKDKPKEKHISYDFYSYAELSEEKNYKDQYQKPVIPGSELRGMIRNIYETLTGSCMSVLNEEEYPVKRTAELFQKGLLKRTVNGYFLYRAEDYRYHENADSKYKTYVKTIYKEGQKLYFEQPKKVRERNLLAAVCECRTQKDDEFSVEGYLIKGMPGPEGKNEKHNAHLFVLKGTQAVAGIKEEDIRRLKGVLKSYQEQPDAGANSYCEYEQALNAFCAGKGEEYFPIYYSGIPEKEPELFYLAPACITKEISHHAVGELAGVMKACGSFGDNCCPACDLFGMIGKTGEKSRGSRIRFADAQTEEKMDFKDYYDEIITLEALGGPKLGNTEFYLVRPKGAKFWTFDYYITESGELRIQPGKLRGRKYYWHQPEVKFTKNIVKTRLNKTVRPVKTGISFTGKLYFDGISEKQLNQLLWVLDGGTVKGDDDRSERLVYKLGNGKPLGLGSVECSVIRKTERKIEVAGNGLRYAEETAAGGTLSIPGYEEAGFETYCQKEFETISSFHAADGMDVTYPVTREQKAEMQKGELMKEGFKWFGENHAVINPNTDRTKMLNKRKDMETKYALPLLCEYKTLLPYSVHDNKMQKQQSHSGKQNPQSRSNPQNSKEAVGTVTGYNKNKNGYITGIQVQTGTRTVRIHAKYLSDKWMKPDELKRKFPADGSVKVKYAYLGKDENGYSKYDFLGKI